MRLGAVLADVTDALEEQLGEYGRNLGVAFQIVDDVLDLTANEETSGKPVASDLREGKATLPVIHAYQHGTPAERAAIDQVLADQSFERVSHAEILAILERHRRSSTHSPPPTATPIWPAPWSPTCRRATNAARCCGCRTSSSRGINSAATSTSAQQARDHIQQKREQNAEQNRCPDRCEHGDVLAAVRDVTGEMS